MNKRSMESLIKAGAFDTLGGNRPQYLAVYDKLMDQIQGENKRNIPGQVSLFQQAQATMEEALPRLKDYDQKQKLEYEREVLGIYVSGHPLESYTESLKRQTDSDTASVKEALESTDVLFNRTLGGLLRETRTLVTKKNQMMAFGVLEDLYGTIELVVFPKVYTSLPPGLFEEGKFITVTGRIEGSEVEEGKILVESIRALDDEDTWGTLFIRLPNRSLQEDIEAILKLHRGSVPVVLYFTDEEKALGMPKTMAVACDDGLLQDLSRYIDPDEDVIRK